MKNLKLKIVSILFLLFILIGNLSMAAYSDVIMSVIKKNLLLQLILEIIPKLQEH